MNSPDLYLAHRELIEDAIAAVCRRRRLPPDEADEFASDARLHFIKDDYAVLRAFAGRSSFRTFAIAVIAHLFLDWRNSRWGKWRPSAEARRLGPLGIRLETMVVRDRVPLDEAIEMLRTNEGVTVPRTELEAMAARFPHRTRRTFTHDDALEEHAAPTGASDEGVVRAEAAETAGRARRALSGALADLEPRDRLLLEMRFTDGRRVQDIARLLDVEPKPLYRRIDRLLLDLRHALESQGLTASDAMDAIHYQGFLHDASADEAESRGDVRLFPQRAPSPAGVERHEGRRP